MNYFIKDTNGKTYIKISFEYAGKNINFDYVTEKMKLQPTIVRKEDEYPEVSRRNGVAKDIWIFSSCYNEGLLIAAEIEKLLTYLSDKIEIINELKKAYNMTSKLIISIQAHIKPYPLIPLSCIEFAYNTRTEIEFDPYYY